MFLAGSGVWRRKPESIIKINKADLKEYVRTQKEILNKASKYCKKMVSCLILPALYLKMKTRVK